MTLLFLPGLLAITCLYATALNWRILVRQLRGTGRTSFIPFLGGIAGAGAILLEPTSSFEVYWYVPLIIDPGSLPGLLVAAILHIRRRSDES